MNLKDYKLSNWNENKIKRKIKSKGFEILLLSTKGIPPINGERNLLAVDASNNILWIAELPTETYDSYIGMKLVNGVILAESSNSFVSEIEPSTGKVLKKYIIK